MSFWLVIFVTSVPDRMFYWVIQNERKAVINSHQNVTRAHEQVIDKVMNQKRTRAGAFTTVQKRQKSSTSETLVTQVSSDIPRIAPAS
ncbi:hypothetical protein HK096_005547 [Nowakowskiella sp. JEL0078]|nr:hypothetical protein HK096_005547 [Nowakowskiella sp. JEL0078]